MTYLDMASSPQYYASTSTNGINWVFSSITGQGSGNPPACCAFQERTYMIYTSGDSPNQLYVTSCLGTTITPPRYFQSDLRRSFPMQLGPEFLDQHQRQAVACRWPAGPNHALLRRSTRCYALVHSLHLPLRRPARSNRPFPLPFRRIQHPAMVDRRNTPAT
jgi:hypothetical protein